MNSFHSKRHGDRIFLWPIYFLTLVSLVSEWGITSLDSRAQYGVGSVARTWLYQEAFLSFTKIDILVIFLFLYLIMVRRRTINYIRLSYSARNFLFLSGSVIVFSFLIALANSVSNPLSFFRPIAHLAMVFLLTRYLIAQDGARHLLIGFVNKISSFYMSIKLILLLIGNGDFVPGIGFVSTYDSYVVYIVLLASLLNLNMVLHALQNRQNPAALNLFLTILGLAFSLSTFVRTVWVIIAIALILCVYSHHGSFFDKKEYGARKVLLGPKLLGGLIAIAVACLFTFSPNFNSRFHSMNIWSTSASTELGGQDNREHLLDIQNGIAAVKVSPILGSGLGAAHDVSGYSYKSKSFGFHNSPLTVWYWTGILGIVLWIQFPFRIWKWSKAMESEYEDELISCFAKTVRIWFSSIFIATSFFSAWPFTSVQFCIFFGLVMGCIAPNRIFICSEESER